MTGPAADGALILIGGAAGCLTILTAAAAATTIIDTWHDRREHARAQAACYACNDPLGTLLARPGDTLCPEHQHRADRIHRLEQHTPPPQP